MYGYNKVVPVVFAYAIIKVNYFELLFDSLKKKFFKDIVIDFELE